MAWAAWRDEALSSKARTYLDASLPPFRYTSTKDWTAGFRPQWPEPRFWQRCKQTAACVEMCGGWSCRFRSTKVIHRNIVFERVVFGGNGLWSCTRNAMGCKSCVLPCRNSAVMKRIFVRYPWQHVQHVFRTNDGESKRFRVAIDHWKEHIATRLSLHPSHAACG